MTVRMTRRVSVRRQRARIAAFALHSQGKASTAAATRTFLTRFEDQADPRREPPEGERQRRALAARRAHGQAHAQVGESPAASSSSSESGITQAGRLHAAGSAHAAQPAGNDEFYLMGRVPKEVYSQLQNPA